MHDDPYVLAKGVEALVILTEWPEFRALDWSRLADATKRPLVIDTRNLLDPDVPERAGFRWVGLGRPDKNAGPA
jgi:UDPglucose 6-dehydrogenase